MPKFYFPIRSRGIRFMLGAMILVLFGLIPISLREFQRQPDPPSASLEQASLKKRVQARMGTLLSNYSGRTASAAGLDGRLDLIADQVYGQPDFTTSTTLITATGSSLNQPGDIAFYPQS